MGWATACVRKRQKRCSPRVCSNCTSRRLHNQRSVIQRSMVLGKLNQTKPTFTTRKARHNMIGENREKLLHTFFNWKNTGIY